MNLNNIVSWLNGRHDMKRLSYRAVQRIYNSALNAYKEYNNFKNEVLSHTGNRVALRKGRRLRELYVDKQTQLAILSKDEEYAEWLLICKLQEDSNA